MIQLEREDDRDLQFEGKVVGVGRWGVDPATADQGSGVVVTIYRVTSSTEPRYVVAATVLSMRRSTIHKATVCTGAKAVLEALLHKGYLGAASKMAWEQACDEDEILRLERYEVL